MVRKQYDDDHFIIIGPSSPALMDLRPQAGDGKIKSLPPA
jgi:hypothetical protein